MAWQRAASLNSIPEGSVVGVDLGATPIALYNLDGTIYATHGICTHAMALLADGWVEDGKIECPLHQGMFDIRTGKALCAPLLEDVCTYAVKVDGDDVFVDLEQPAAVAEAALSPVAVTQGANAGTTRRTESADTTAGPTLTVSKQYAWPEEG